MELDKIRNLSGGELKLEEAKAAEQLFRLRFQMKLGQSEGVKKLRGLKKDVARIQTIARERELGLNGETPKAESVAPVAKKRAAAKATTTKAKTAKTKKEAR
jgi:large subunit ribosomal protein L29